MERVIACLGLGFPAFAVWLTIRIINRREKWAIRAGVVTLALLTYPLSVFPTCWLAGKKVLAAPVAAAIYDPYFWIEYHAPPAIQDAILQCATSVGVGPAYVGLRDTPFQRSYPVGDLNFRWQKGKRIPDTDPWLLNLLETTTEPDSWEDLSGPGTLKLSPDHWALDVLQSRRVHREVDAFLEQIRLARQSVARGRDIDAPEMLRLFRGVCSDKDIRPDAIRISNPTENCLAVGECTFTSVGSLLDYLGQQSRESLRPGVYWSEWRCEPTPEETERLKTFCQARNVDLFIRPYYGCIIGQALPRNWWIVCASDSIYLDPR